MAGGKFLGFLNTIFGEKANNIVGTVIDGVDRFVTNPQERQTWEMEKEQLKAKIQFEFAQLQFQSEKLYTEDRQSARATFERKGFLHTVFALSFLLGYFVITGGLVWFIWNLVRIGMGSPEASQAIANIPSWAAALIGGIFSAMSSKVNTIVDFLFGGSDTTDTSEMRVQQAITAATNQNTNSGQRLEM